MDATPQAVASATFRVTKKGYDPDEVRAYLANVARALGDATDRANHMETRARQAVARVQELQASAERAPAAERTDDPTMISRALLLAQKTADDTVAQARFEADQFRISARGEADQMVTDAHSESERIVTDARAEARTVADAEKLRAEAELQQLLIRLEFLRDDVNLLEDFTASQRIRLHEAAVAIREVADRPVGGLGEVGAPELKGASSHDEPTPTGVYADLQDTWPDDEAGEEVAVPLGPGAALLAAGESGPDAQDLTRAMPVPVPVVDATVDLAAEPSTRIAKMFHEVPDADDLVVEEITAEVPIFQRPPQQNTMRFIDDE